MGAAVTLSHADIDPKSIEVPSSFGHADIDPKSIELAQPKASPPDSGIMSTIGDAAASAGKSVLSAIATAGREIDRYTGAPIRTTIGAAQDGQQDPIAYALSRWGQDPANAPTGKQIVMKAGLDDTHHLSEVVPGYADKNSNHPWYQPEKGGLLDPSAADAGGLAMNVATDPLMYVPGGEVGRLAKKAGEVAPKIGGGVASVGRKLSAELTGIPDKEIEAYAMRTDKVNDIISKSKDQGKFDSQIAANHMRDNINNDVARTTKELNGQISQVLKTTPQDKVFSSAPIKQSLTDSISQLHPVYQSEDIPKVQKLISKIDQTAPSGFMSAQDLQSTKQYLYDASKGSYKEGHEFFGSSSEVSNAAKQAGFVAKTALDAAPGLEALKNANRQLSQLHDIEDALGSSILDKNKQAGSLYSVGGGSNPKDALALKQLGGVTGQNYLEGITDMSAARSFGNASLLSDIKTGRSILGPAIGAAIGGAGGAVLGGHEMAYMGAKFGGGIGAVISSPTALKAAINAGQISQDAMSAVGKAFGVNPQNLTTMARVLEIPEAQQMLMRVGDQNQPSGPRFSTTIKSKSSLSK